MNRPKLLAALDLSTCPEALDALRDVAEVDEIPEDRALLLDRIGGYDAYFGHTNLRLDREVIDRARRLRVVGAPSTGTDHIEIEVLNERGIHLIAITREYELLDRFTATAECAWALLLAGMRRIPYQYQGVRSRRVASAISECPLSGVRGTVPESEARGRFIGWRLHAPKESQGVWRHHDCPSIAWFR